MSPATLQRQNFQTSRLLEYFSEKELILQTGHEPDRWLEVILKELLDNAADGCESHGILPEIHVTITDNMIRVEDNGPGLPAAVVRSALDFSVRVSSKDAYISPTRGAQGNALKTIFAIPFVLADRRPEPITITSRGRRHTITVSVDPLAQIPQIQHDSQPATVRNGTCVEVPVGTPKEDAWRWFLPPVMAFSLLNPHVTIRLTDAEGVHTFTRTADTWTKWRPTDPTSPHWYTVEQFRTLIAAYVHAERHGGRVLFVRDFLEEFRGLASTVKRAAILDGLSLAGKHVHDLVGDDGDLDKGLITQLLRRMQEVSSPVKPAALGVLGETHLRTWLEARGGNVQTVTYKRIADVDLVTGLPFVLEVAFAARQDDDPDVNSIVITGLNFSPTLVNPFRSVRMRTSLDSLLESLHVAESDPVIIVVHLVAPGLRFTDRGKSTLDTPATVGDALVEAVTCVTKAWTALKKKELRDASRSRRQREEYHRMRAAEEWSVKDAAYQVMAEAYAKAAGQLGLAPARMIFYVARPLMQQLTDKPIDDEYFTQTLLPSYLADHPEQAASWDVVYDARGHFWEPHTGKQVDIGTVDVRSYLGVANPAHHYSAVLFIEKEGFIPLLERAQIAERYDLAIMSTKGMSSTAARMLMEGLPGVRFLCLHDFDKAGFSIIGILTRDTQRYQFRVRPDVVDLGLRLTDVLTEGLAAETCSYGKDKDPATNLRLNGATEDEVTFLLEGGGQRVELNAFTSDRFIAWLEAKLQAAGVVKLIPDDDTLTVTYQNAVYDALVEKELAKIRAAAMTQAFATEPPADLRASVERWLRNIPTMPWDRAVRGIAASGRRESE